jgi:ABC-type lipoprotein release transport system permease subunit
VLGVDLQIAARNLTRHTRRNLFLGGALATVTALLVLLGGLTAGIQHTMMRSATTLMTGHVNVAGFFKVTSGAAAPLVSDYPRVLEIAAREVPDAAFIVVRGRGWAKAVSEATSMDLVLTGVDVTREPGFRGVIVPVHGALEDLAKPGAVLLFERQADRLRVKVGDVLTLSAPTGRGVNNTADVHVAVVARNVGLLSAAFALIQADTLRGLYDLNATTTGAIHVYLRDPADAAGVASRLRTALAGGGWRVMDPDPIPYWMKLMQKVPAEDWTGQKIDVTTWEDELGMFNKIMTAVQIITFILVLVLMLVIVVGILNTLAIAVRERTREIGTLRAIGMQRTKVLWLFVLETALLGTGGAVGGALAGSAVAALLNVVRIPLPESVQIFLASEHLTFRVVPGTVLLDVALLAAITTVASVLPAIRAARLRPVTAMHHVG